MVRYHGFLQKRKLVYDYWLVLNSSCLIFYLTEDLSAQDGMLFRSFCRSYKFSVCFLRVGLLFLCLKGLVLDKRILYFFLGSNLLLYSENVSD